ncbi:MAG: hypothetical protein ACI9WC_000254 [Arenicella sp.]
MLAAYYQQDFEATIKIYQDAKADPAESMPDDFALALKPAAKIAVAYAYKKLGKLEDSRAIITEVEQTLDQKLQTDQDSSAENWFLKVKIAALKNDEMKVRQFMQKRLMRVGDVSGCPVSTRYCKISNLTLQFNLCWRGLRLD